LIRLAGLNGFAHWSRYRTLSKLNQEEEQLQVDSFLYCMGNKSESIFNGLALSGEDIKDYQKVSEAFQKYFSPRKYVI